MPLFDHKVLRPKKAGKKNETLRRERERTSIYAIRICRSPFVIGSVG